MTPICELRIDANRAEPESVSVDGVDLERTDADPTSGEWTSTTARPSSSSIPETDTAGGRAPTLTGDFEAGFINHSHQSLVMIPR